MRAKFVDAAVEYRAPGAHTAETLCLPFHALGDFEGKKDEPVELSAASKGRAIADQNAMVRLGERGQAPCDCQRTPLRVVHGRHTRSG